MPQLRMGGDSGEVLSKVRTIVAQQLAVEESQVVPEASFTQDLGADSLDTVELIMALEEGFDVSFSCLVYFDCIRHPVVQMSSFFVQLLDNPWPQVLSLLSPRSCLPFLSRIGLSNPTVRRFFIECC